MTTSTRAFVPMTLKETSAALHIEYDNARSRMKRLADGKKVRLGFPEPVGKHGADWVFDAKTVNRFIKDHGITGPVS